MADNEKIVTVERFIPAPAEEIFDLIANPRRHPELDGSGTVKQADVDGPERVGLGDRFGMAMKWGVPYRMVSEVVEFEENRRIAWAPKSEVFGKVIEGGTGRIYRYELEPVEGGTTVRQTWDATKEKGWPIVKLMGLPKKVGQAMAATLEKIERLVTA
jgi:uncharacterized protein YndB with AHSA1/START domain